MLQVNNISKKLASNLAVNEISFEVEKGSFYGLLGPNGAGKTTAIHMISAIMEPDTGTICIDGQNIYKHVISAKQKLGVVPQEIALYDELSALENLIFWGSLYGANGKDAKKRANYLLEWVGLSDRKNDLIYTYSGGMKRRINIAAALMHEPDLIIMDEPTVGIDPQSRNKIYSLLEELHAENKTILYTTHYMEEAERLCTKIGIIDKGKIITEGTLAELHMHHAKDEQVIIQYSGNGADTLNGFTIKHDFEKNELIVFVAHAKNALPEIVKKCSDAGLNICNIDIKSINLENIFLNLTGRQLRD